MCIRDSNYTWGKTVSDYPFANTLAENGSTGYGYGGFQYPNLYDRGEASGSHRHRFVFSGIWSPEYGKGWPVWARMPLSGWRPVSYTHLDVYKRQTYPEANINPGGTFSVGSQFAVGGTAFTTGGSFQGCLLYTSRLPRR